ncbi:MAG: GNAT family N-acetyltransferase [Anaerolineae bacterium]|nr:GNAT family N-acetyltransferase [Anaerolineae bacterium]
MTIYELQPSDFEKARPVFAGLKDRVIIHAIIEGNSAGRIFVDDVNKPTAAFTWNELRYSYLAGDPDHEAFNESLRDLLTQTLLPEAKVSHDPTLVLYPYPVSWQAKVDALVGGRKLIPVTRKTFAFDPARFAHYDWADRTPPGFHMRRVDETVLADSEHVAGEVALAWRSPERFLAKGVGFCLCKDDNTAVCACLSISADRRQEISIGAHPDYRRRGFATLTGAAFIAHCIEHDQTPVWECWTENVPSVKLAEKLGFKPTGDYPVYFLNLMEDNRV